MIASADIAFLLSAPQAAAGHVMPGTPGNCLGLYASTSLLSTADGGDDNIFTDLTGAQNAALAVDYACLFIWNNNQSGNTMINPVAWLPTQLLGSGNTATFAVGADTNNPSALAATAVQALSIASPVIAPSGIVTWAAPSSSPASGVPLPNIPPGYVMPVWIRRTASGSAGLNQVGIEVTFDSLA